MPGIVNLNRNQLTQLIEKVKADGGDTGELQQLLAKYDMSNPTESKKSLQDEVQVQQDTATGDMKLRYILGLFAENITEQMLAEIAEYNKRYSSQQLQRMCEEAGLSTAGKKLILAGRLVASAK